MDGTTYYIQVTELLSCCLIGRDETKGLLSNPEIIPAVPESCPGDVITLTATDVPQTALDFELANPTLTKLLELGQIRWSNFSTTFTNLSKKLGRLID